MPVRLTILGSGSSGNCTHLETDHARILIDAGLSGRQIKQRLESIQRGMDNLSGIVITHEHSDHIQGLSILAAKLGVPVYCNRLTREYIESIIGTGCQFRIFETGNSFEIGDVVVDTFSVPHDASDPVGFLLRTPAGNLGFLTDLGHATKMVLERIRSSRVLMIESNHDVQMLMDDTRRPWSLKQRILSRHGHLSNESAAEALEHIMSADLHHVYLCHLSQDCNRSDTALRVATERMSKIGAGHVRIEVTSQKNPNAPLIL